MILTPILTGPTASGKTALALELANQFSLEIINADSLLVYRKFNIGTAKPSSKEQQQFRHHLIDIRDPEETYTAADFTRDVELHLREIHNRGKRALIVGGTPFYLKALSLGLWEAPPTHPDFRERLQVQPTSELFNELSKQDPLYAKKIGPADRYRMIRGLEILQFSGKKPSQLLSNAQDRTPDPRFPIWVLDRPQEDLAKRIQSRTQEMLDSGLIQETQGLLQDHPQARALTAIGYAQVILFLKGDLPNGRQPKPGIEGLSEEIQLATRQLTKAQKTFFRGLKYCEWFLFERDRLKLMEHAKKSFEDSNE